MNSAGNRMICGKLEIMARPADSMLPMEVLVEESRLTIPKYVILDSDAMTPGIIKTALVISVPKAFGKICLNISRKFPAPSVRADKIYS